MKNFTTLKTLLVGLMALGATSAWGETGTATVKMTYINGSAADTSYGEVETAYCGYNKISGGKVELANSGWGVNNIAYLQVDASAIEGNITKVELALDCQQISARGLNYGVGYNTTEWSSDITWNTADRSITAMGAVQSGSKATADAKKTFDITEAFKDNESKIATILVYQTAAGGGYVKNPVATVTYTNETVYDVTFKESNDVKATITVNGSNVTNGASMADGTYDFTATATGYKDYTGQFTVSGESIEVSFTMTAKALWDYTVLGKDSNGGDLGVVSTGSDFENSSITYYYPENVLIGETLYVKAKNSGDPYWGASGTLDSNDKEFTVTGYEEKLTDIVFYKEAEDIEGFTAQITNNATIRCSNGTGGIVTDSESPVELVTLPAGNYKIYGQVWGTAGVTAAVTANDENIWTLESTGSLVSSNATFTLDSETTLYISTAGGNEYRMLDYVYIQKMAAPFNYTINCVDDDNNTIQEITKNGYEGQTLNIVWNKYIKVDGQWYVTEAPYGGAYTEEGSSNVVYKKADIYDFIELENTSYKTAGDTENNTNASGGKAVLLASGSAMATKEKIAAGTYDFSVYGFVRRANEDILKLQISTDNSNWTDVVDLTFESSKAQTQTARNIVLTEDSYVRFLESKTQNTCHFFDYLVITETPSAIEITVDAEAGYATYCSEYALTLDGIEAYTATVNGTEVTFTEQMNNTVAPGTGLLIKANGKVTLPIAAEGETVADNALIGVTKNTKVGAGNFVLMYDPYVGFFKTSGEFTVGANTAYLAAPAGARIVLPGNDATAIKAIEAEKNGEVYNLAGQRVVKAQKGLYIMNGKKVVVK